MKSILLILLIFTSLTALSGEINPKGNIIFWSEGSEIADIYMELTVKEDGASEYTYPPFYDSMIFRSDEYCERDDADTFTIIVDGEIVKVIDCNVGN